MKEYMEEYDAKLQNLMDLAGALKIVYKTACDHCHTAESHIFNTNNPEMMKYSLDELRKMKEDALVEWHTARNRVRAVKKTTPIRYVHKSISNIDYNHNDSWYRVVTVDKEMK